MKKIIFSFLLVLSFVSSVNALDTKEVIYDITKGFGFLKACKNFDTISDSYHHLCAGYFRGIVETTEVLGREFGIVKYKVEVATYRKHLENFTKYLENNPKELDNSTIELIIIYFFELIPQNP